MRTFPPSCRWNASWIWTGDASRKNAWVLFRAGFDCSAHEDARLFITADTRYREGI